MLCLGKIFVILPILLLVIVGVVLFLIKVVVLTKLVIVLLGEDARPIDIDLQLFPSEALMINAHDALLRNLFVVSEENYLKQYAHWRGLPPRIVDRHPNEAAHKIIAAAVVAAIRQADTQ